MSRHSPAKQANDFNRLRERSVRRLEVDIIGASAGFRAQRSAGGEGVMQLKSVKGKLVACVRRVLEGEVISD